MSDMLGARRNLEKAFYIYQAYAQRAIAEERYTSAIIFLQKALEIDPSNTSILIKLGKTYRVSGNTGRAIETFNRVLRILGWSSHPQVHEARQEIHELTVSEAAF